MDANVSLEGVQIVLIGQFNPTMFSPDWFLHNNLIDEHEALNRKIIAIVPNFSSFEVAYLSFECLPDRVTFASSQSSAYELLRDLVVQFLDLSPGTSINMMGLNRYFHMQFPNEDSWHRVGDALAPKDPWQEQLLLPGMQDVTIKASRRDHYAGNVVVIVQPSSVVTRGVYCLHNDHYVLKTVERTPTSRSDLFDPEMIEDQKVPPATPEMADLAKSILLTNWDESLERAEQAADLIWNVRVRS